MRIETREFTTELEIRGDGRTIVGRAVPYGEETRIGDNVVEVFHPGSFRDADPAKVSLTARHPRDGGELPIGVAVSLEDRADGCWITGRVSKTALGDEVLELVRDGALMGLSIGFLPDEATDRWSRDRSRVDRYHAHLDHVAVGRRPAYAGAQIAAVRATPEEESSMARGARRRAREGVAPPKGYTREERAFRIRELETYVSDQLQQYGQEEMPLEVRQQLGEANEELVEHREAMQRYEERDAHLRQLANTPNHRENGWDDGSLAGRRDAVEQWPSGRQVSRGDPWQGRLDGSRSDLRSRALDAIERCKALPQPAAEAATSVLQRDIDPESRLARFTVLLSQPAYMRAFASWMRDPMAGHYEWTPDERDAYRTVVTETRAMGITTGGAGGFLVPYELDPQILIASAGSVDPMREVARVAQTAYNEKRFVTSLGVTASWDPEAQEVSDDSPTLLQPALKAFKGQAFVPVSFELYEDSDIAQQVGELFADAKLQLEAAAFTTGAGVTLPTGIITALVAAGGAVVIATGTNVLAQGDLYANQAALPARWRPRARWMMNLSIINRYRQLPQATGLNYSIINDDGPLPRALGWEVRENSTMDGTLSAAAADYTVLSGDFRQYAIIDRVGTTIELVPHLFGAAFRPTGQRGFLLHWRTGGDVLIPDAFRLTNHNT